MGDSERAKYPPSSEREYRIVKPIMKVVSWLNTWVFEASGGRLLNRFPGGGVIGLLTTTGRKTGRRRTAPLCYGREGDRVVLVASQGGLPHHPVWYLNLCQHPEVEFQIGRERRPYRARVAENEERTHYWQVACAAYADFAEYQKRTEREIPVIVLEPR